MEALGTMRQHSLMRTRSNVFTPVFVYTVGVGNKVDFKTTNMEDELQFSPKKCLHCVATVTKQFCRFHLHLSSLPPACPTRNATLPLWRQFHSLPSVIKNVISASTWRQSEVLADEPAQDFKFVQVVDSWDSTDTLPVLDLSLKEAVSKMICDMVIPVTPLISHSILWTTIYLYCVRKAKGTNIMYSALK